MKWKDEDDDEERRKKNGHKLIKQKKYNESIECDQLNRNDCTVDLRKRVQDR